MALLFSSTDKDAADDFLASSIAQYPLAECRVVDGTYQVHDMPVGYFSPAMLGDMVERVYQRVIDKLTADGIIGG